MKKSFFTFLFIYLSNLNFAQTTGDVRFAIGVDNGYFEILINDTLLLKRYRDTLPVGRYNAVVWSPTYQPKEITFDVQPGINKMLYVKMDKTEKYLEYKKDDEIWERKKSLMVRLPVITSTICTALTLTSHGLVRKYEKELNELIPLYPSKNGVSRLKNYKLDLDYVETRYNRYRMTYYMGLGITSVLWVTSAITVKKFISNYRHNVPKYKDKSPWFDQFSFVGGPNFFQITYSI